MLSPAIRSRRRSASSRMWQKRTPLAEKIRRSIADGDFAEVMRIASRRTGETIEAHSSPQVGRDNLRTVLDRRARRDPRRGIIARASPRGLDSSRSASSRRRRSVHYMEFLRHLLNLEVNSRRLHWNPVQDPRVKFRPSVRADSLSLGARRSALNELELPERDGRASASRS